MHPDPFRSVRAPFFANIKTRWIAWRRTRVGAPAKTALSAGTGNAEAFRALTAGFAAGLLICSAPAAFADGGAGNAGRTDVFGGAGGVDSATGPGGAGGAGGGIIAAGGGGGGGAGATGGAGGTGVGGIAGGTGGASPGAAGQPGADFTTAGTNSGGGGGGGGGAHGSVGAALPGGASNGGAGGAGGASTAGGGPCGGGGGAGGFGAVITGSGALGTLATAVSGGVGGVGGNTLATSNGPAGNGGTGGTGLVLTNTNGVSLTIGAAVSGGAGGAGGIGPFFQRNGYGGPGGIGVQGQNLTLALTAIGLVTGGAGGAPGGGDDFYSVPGGVGLLGSGITLSNAGAISGGLGSGTFGRAFALDLSGTNTITDIGTLVGGVNISGGTTTFNLATNQTLANVISGAGALTKTGTGTLTLSGANTYSGLTTVQAGTLNVANAGALGTSAGGTTVNSGATLLITGSSPTLVLADALTISGTGSGGIGAIRVEPNANPGNQAANLSGGITLTADAAITATDRMLWLFTGSGIGLGSSTLTFNSEGTGNSTTRVNSAISGTGGLIKNGLGLLELNAANTFTGPVMLNDGDAVLRGGSALADSVAVTVGNGAILYVDASETIGSLAGTGSVTLGNGVTLTTGANNTSTTFAGTSPNGMVGMGRLTKVGTGTLTLTGTNTYSGGTTVTAGTLLVTGSLTSLVTVNDTGTAGGSGTLGGGVVVNAGGRLAPGLSATTGILRAAAVTLTSGSTYHARLNGTTAGTGYDQLQATGNVALGGATLSIAGSITPPAGTPFTLIQTTGALSGTFQGLANGATLTVGPTLYRIAYTTTAVTLTPIIANLTRLQADAAFDLFAATGQPPGSGSFSGPGVSGGNYQPGAAVGVNTITFTPNTGSPVTFTITVTETPSLTVTTTSDVVSNTDGQTSLREAIAYANTLPGTDTITFGGTVFSDAVADTISLAGTRIQIATPVEIQGPGAHLLRVSGNNASRIFEVVTSLGVVRIEGLSLVDGHAVGAGNGGAGGAIFHFGTGSLFIQSCVLQDNRADTFAGAINHSNGLLEIRDSTLTGNTAASNGTGGGAIVSTGTLNIVNTSISGNSSPNATAGNGGGGGIVSFGQLNLSHSTITGNRTSIAAGGGGIDARGNETITHSIIAGNFVGTGTTPSDIGALGPIESATHNLVGDAGTSGGITNGTNGKPRWQRRHRHPRHRHRA